VILYLYIVIGLKQKNFELFFNGENPFFSSFTVNTTGFLTSRFTARE